MVFLGQHLQLPPVPDMSAGIGQSLGEISDQKLLEGHQGVVDRLEVSPDAGPSEPPAALSCRPVADVAGQVPHVDSRTPRPQGGELGGQPVQALS